ncbi:MAG: sigma-70 family RNA polymerase sigma factor [Planctomycetes bacterium]|nr:sigma-70 family RNA polymerase sigma factor [Planctomycetota bacterium]
MPDSSDLPRELRCRQFATTQWSLVAAAADADHNASRQALAALCDAYWYPVYAYVRRRVSDRHAAQDLTQGFFSHLLEKQILARADRERGRFRAFLLASVQNFLLNEREHARALKRGGDCQILSLDFTTGESRYLLEPSHELTAEKLFERRWVLTLLDQVLSQLRGELSESGKPEYFEQFQAALTGEANSEHYANAAANLGITEAAAKQAAYRLRKRYRELFREEVARTVGSREDVDQELQLLLKSLE